MSWLKPASLFRKAAPTAILLGLALWYPFMSPGGSPKAEDCPGGTWIRQQRSCGGDYWECSSNGETTELDQGPPDPANGVDTSRRLPLSFERNIGQAPLPHQFIARTHTQTLLLSGGDAVLQLKSRGNFLSLRLELDGADMPEVEAEEPLPGLVNYFVGSDPTRWLTNVPSFGRVRYRNVYPGIDVTYYGKEGELEHDFIVRPGADPSQVRMRFVGATDVRLEADGSATVWVGERRVAWRKPVLYQPNGRLRQPVEGRYRLDEAGRLAFEVAPYNRHQPLVIDPVISYSTYFGRSSAEGGAKLGVDAQGNVVVAGVTMDPGFPRTPGAAANGAGAGNALIVKMNPTGTAAVFTTYLGGAFVDGALGMALDRDGNIYVASNTSSADFPTTPGAFKTALQPPGAPNDPFDCVVTKLSASGSALLYSTYLGGSLTDSCHAITVDAAGSAYVTGHTLSENFPRSDAAPQRVSRGGGDGFITKLNPAGSALVYSTLFGGTARDTAMGIAVDSAGAAYVVGHTVSGTGFPVTPGALQRTYRGNITERTRAGDAFVLKLNPAGTEFVYGTYLGGTRDDLAFAVAVDAQGNAYVAGNTLSRDFPLTDGALQTTYRSTSDLNNIYPGGDGFVAKLNPSGTALVYSTYLGGDRDDWATGIAVDAAGNAYLTGATLSTNFPLSADAHQRTMAGSDPELGFPTGDAFVTQLNAAGSALVYSTYLGGAADEFGTGIVLDASGSIYVTGQTRSRNFPVTPGVAQASFGGVDSNFLPFGDVFITRFAGTGSNPASNVQLRAIGSAASYAGTSVSPGELVVLFGSGIGPANLTTLALTPQGSVSASLAGTRVLFDEVPAPLVYVSAGQSSAIVPYAVAGRAQTQVVLEYQGQRSAPLTMPVSPSKPGLFSANGSGTGPGAILNEDASVNTPANPSPRGRVIVLFGTGGGQTTPPGVDGQIANTVFPRLALPVTVTIGGRTADVLYAGGAPGQVAGVMQLNVKVPEDTPPGNAEVLVTIGAARSAAGLTVAVRE